MSQVKTIAECKKYFGYKLLNCQAQKIYCTLCKQQLENGEIPYIYLDQLTLYAHSYADFLALDQQVKEKGHTLVSRDKRGDNRLYPNPAVKMRRDALADLMRIAKNFGFTKLDKERLKAMPEGEGSFMNFLEEFSKLNED